MGVFMAVGMLSRRIAQAARRMGMGVDMFAAVAMRVAVHRAVLMAVLVFMVTFNFRFALAAAAHCAHNSSSSIRM